MDEAVIKFLQGSAVTKTYYKFTAKFFDKNCEK